LDIYTGPVGQANLLQQIHDYSPPIASNGLFWTIPVHPDSLEVDLDEGTASLHISDLAIGDAHDVANSLTGGHGFANPPIPPISSVPVTVSFDVEFAGAISRETVVNEAQNFRGDFIKTGSTIKWSSQQAEFAFESEDPDPSRSVGAVIGRERNGVFFNDEIDEQ
jgi:hypothetical protein